MVMSDQPVRAVLFDMTGTLHSQTQLGQAVAINLATMREMLGIDHPVDDMVQALRAAMAAAFKRFMAVPFYLTADVYREGYSHGLQSLGVACTAAQMELIIEDFRHAAARTVSPQEGAVELLTSLRSAGIRTGVVSVNDERDLDMLIDSCGFRERLDFVLSSEAARSCKPDEAVFLQAMELTGVPAARTVFVGDMPAMDIVGANRAGMRSVLLTQEAGFVPQIGEGQAAETPDYTLSHLREFGPAVLGRNLA